MIIIHAPNLPYKRITDRIWTIMPPINIKRLWAIKKQCYWITLDHPRSNHTTITFLQDLPLSRFFTFAFIRINLVYF